MPTDPSEEGAGYGYATRQNNTCAGSDQACYITWGGFRTCCPESSTCTKSRTAGVCCPDSEDCTDLFINNNAHCADEYADLYNVGKSAGLGYFCCSNDTTGFLVDGRAVSCAKDLDSAGPNASSAKLASSANTSTSSIASSTEATTATQNTTTQTTATQNTTAQTTATQTTATRATTSPTSAPASEDSGSSNTGSIAGGVVGGVVGAAILLVLAWWLLRRRKQQKGYQSPGQPADELGEHSGTVLGELPESKTQTAAELPQSKAMAELPQSKDQIAAELAAPNNKTHSEPAELWSGPGDR